MRSTGRRHCELDPRSAVSPSRGVVALSRPLEDTDGAATCPHARSGRVMCADLRCCGLAGLVGKSGAKSFGKLLIAKRLGQRGVFSETRWKLARTIAGGENDRH